MYIKKEKKYKLQVAVGGYKILLKQYKEMTTYNINNMTSLNTHKHFTEDINDIFESNYYIDSELQMQSKLILFIKNKDTTLFVGWSQTNKSYYVRGNNKNKNVPFGFYIDKIDNCLYFIQCICKDIIDITLYNFNNIMYWDEDDLTYDFFESYIDKDYEMISNIKKGELRNILRLIKKTYNYYKEEPNCKILNKCNENLK